MSASFKIYYGDGSVYDGPVIEAPPLNVQCIVTHDERGSSYELGRKIMHSWDFYLYAEGEWIGVNGMVDLVDHILHRPVEKTLKGRMISAGMYESILERARTDPDFPPKTADNATVEDGR